MKSILILRASTVSQEVEKQKTELLEFAKSFSDFDENNYLPVGREGLSAIKQDAEYRAMIEEVYNTIEKEPIKCVYAWSIDRIGRNEETLMKFKNELIQHGVNLRIANPSLELYDREGKVNSGVELCFSLWATLSKQEMEIKKERMRRGKADNTAKCRYNGGPIMYGYTVKHDEGKNRGGVFVENPVESEVVRYIFEAYAHTPKSTREIAKDIINRGWYKDDLKSAQNKVFYILNEKEYIGNGKHPQIITEYLFNECAEKRQKYTSLPRDRKVYIDYTKGLVYLQQGFVEIEDDGEEKAKYERLCLVRRKQQLKNIDGDFYLNINNLDTVTIEVLQRMFDGLDFSTFDKERAEKIKGLQRQIEREQKEIGKLDARRDEIEEKFVMGTIRHYEKYINIIETERKAHEKTIVAKQNEIARLNAISTERPDLYKMTANEKKECVNNYVTRIIVQRPQDNTPLVPVDFCFRGLPCNGVQIYLDRKNRRYFYTHEPFEWRTFKPLIKELVTKL